ncbi:MAG: DUF5723 family protein [Phaeodactylibacter sp.]|uniref:DUF5723 family protein n=1 Tax=Phaeodactylibacter sp. TaxID=1940289 RepID=UPI0032EE51A9
MRMKLLLAAVALAVLPTAVMLAQQDLSTHFLRHTWQAHQTNPALFPEYEMVIGLPGVYNSLRVENLTYNTLFVEDGNGNRMLNVDQAILDMEDRNVIRENLDIETLSLGARFGPLGLSLSHTFRFSAFMDYPKTLPQLIWQGNAQFIGQEIEFAPDIDVLSYQEFAIGALIELGDAVVIGGRAKLLSGVGSVNSSRSQLRLRTDDEIYQLRLDADYQVNSASALTYDGFDDIQTNFDFSTFSAEDLFTGNTGFAFDLGAHVKLGKLELAASVLDIGGIDWDEEVNNYSLKGTYEYEGLDFAQRIFDDSTSFGSVLDTLEQIYEVQESAEGFRTTIPTRFYLSATLRLRDNWTVGGLIFNEWYRGNTYPAAAISTNLEVLPFLNVGGIYSWRSNRFDNFGINATLKAGPLQLFAATDNILTVFRPKDSNSSHIRLGLNLLFAPRESKMADSGPKWF